MDFISTLAATRVILILGVINLLTGVCIFFSCRCLPGSRIGVKLTGFRWYQRFFKYHCFLWWIFWPSVMLHATLTIIFLGWPG
ncbi:MAG: hypothetical protein U1D67_06115 [Dehalococcoidia bacterium]|nr:hypothetical protein [Dehalococcoidia bacterium]MDZ4246673.1 hypothetical protein [Dehalococcoidia bacterium]